MRGNRCAAGVRLRRGGGRELVERRDQSGVTAIQHVRSPGPWCAVDQLVEERLERACDLACIHDLKYIYAEHNEVSCVRAFLHTTRIPHHRIDTAGTHAPAPRPTSTPDTTRRNRRIPRPRPKGSRRPSARPRRLRGGAADPRDHRRHPLPVRLRRSRGQLLALELLREGWHGAVLRRLPGPGPASLPSPQGWQIPRRHPRRHR